MTILKHYLSNLKAAKSVYYNIGVEFMHGTFKINNVDWREQNQNLDNSLLLLCNSMNPTSECFFVHLILVKFI